MKILLTCGIGDFIAIESLMSIVEVEEVETVYYATRQERFVRELIPFCFSNVREQITLFDQFTGQDTKLFCFQSKEEVWRNTRKGWKPWSVVDMGALRIAEEYWANARRYQGSSLTVQLADISAFNLPDQYMVLHPYSENARKDFRDIQLIEWQAIGEGLKRLEMKGVLLNQGAEQMPALDNVIDLSNQTTLLQALEIVKGAQAFTGCSSCLSVMAAKAGVRNLIVKGHEGLRTQWWQFYYAPVTQCPVYTSLVPQHF